MERCVNCGERLSGEYCHCCGQAARSRIKPFVELIVDIAGDVFAYDSRVWRTLRRLVISPGFLSSEYVEGRRVPYTPPFRLYLVVSFLCFLTLGLAVGGIDIDVPDEVVDQVTAEMAAEMAEVPEGDAADTWLERQGLALASNVPALIRNPAVLLNNLTGMLPQTMFILLPVLAFVATLAYWRSRRHYIEHLVFMMHTHAFVFLAVLVILLASQVNRQFQGPLVSASIEWMKAVLGIWVMAYVLFAMKKFYRQDWFATTVKYLSLTAVYGALLIVSTSVVAVLAIANL